MKQGGWRCSKCGKAGRLEVHHIIPISEGGTNDPENLCHVFVESATSDIHRRQVSERERAWETHVAEMREGGDTCSFRSGNRKGFLYYKLHANIAETSA